MNLDVLCAQYGQIIVQDVAPSDAKSKSKLENTITKSLGVLQEDGVYAFFLFLDYYRSRSESMGADAIAQRMKDLLRGEEIGLLQDRSQNERDDFAALRSMTGNLKNLLLARQLLEQALIYARYHAKALQVT